MPHDLRHASRAYFGNLALLAQSLVPAQSQTGLGIQATSSRVPGRTLRLRKNLTLAALLCLLIACGQFSHASDVLNTGEHFADVNGVRLWYRVAGHGPILVIQAPGWGPASPLLQRYLI